MLKVFPHRPRCVIRPNNTLWSIVGFGTNPLYRALKAEELAAAMIDVRMKGVRERCFCMRSCRLGYGHC